MPIQPNSIQEAAIAYSDANDEHTKALSSFYEKLALYSGGVISLSITFIGYLISVEVDVLTEEAFSVPLYEIVFLGWGLLFVTLLVGIYIRVFTAEHTSRMLHAEWVRLHAEERKEMVAMAEEGRLTFNGIAPEDEPEKIEELRISATEFAGLAELSKGRAARYGIVGSLLRKSAFFFFIIGNLCVLLFSALSILVLAGIDLPCETASKNSSTHFAEVGRLGGYVVQFKQYIKISYDNCHPEVIGRVYTSTF